MASPHLYPPSPIPSYVAPHAPSPALSAYEQQQQQPPPFAPFFTLIANPASTVHKHPIVHYVFADDDFDPVTETALAAADSAASAGRPRDRVVVVDIAADGETVAAAHSLSKEWQVVGVNTAPAPQWMASVEDSSGGGGGGGNKAGGVVGGGGLMLTVEGTERSGLQLKKTESVYELAEIFAERMALIKRVIDYGQKSSNASS